MTEITREDAELIAAALGVKLVEHRENHSSTFTNGHHSLMLSHAWDFAYLILGLAKRVGPKPRDEKEEAKVIGEFLGCALHKMPNTVCYEAAYCIDRIHIEPGGRVWNKLYSLAKQEQEKK